MIKHSQAEINKITDEVISSLDLSPAPSTFLSESSDENTPKRIAPKVVKSIKDAIRLYFSQNPAEFKAFVRRLIDEQPSLVWQQLEGKPAQDITSGGEKLLSPLVIEKAILVLNNLINDNATTAQSSARDSSPLSS